MFIRTTLSTGFMAIAFASPLSRRVTCELATLQAATDNYIAAQIAGDATKLMPVTAQTAYTENFKEADLSKGILSQALAVAHNHSLHDTTACSTYLELIITDTKHPSVTGTQMYFAPGGSSINKIETLVTDKGDWLFDVAGTLKWASQEKWDEIPEAQRDTRAVIQAAADAYADIFNNKSVVVPWGQPCARLEGGSVSTSIYQLNSSSIPSISIFEEAHSDFKLTFKSTLVRVKRLTGVMLASPVVSRTQIGATLLTKPKEASTCL